MVRVLKNPKSNKQSHLYVSWGHEPRHGHFIGERLRALHNMNRKLTWFEKINIANIIATLILSFVTLVISYNSYRISENLNRLNDRQSEFELNNTILSLVTVSNMLRQTEPDTPNISRCIKSFSEMKSLLESQMKNSSLIKRSKLSSMWTELHRDITFNIKLFEEGLRPKTIIDQAREQVVETEDKCISLYEEYSRTDIKIEE